MNPIDANMSTGTIGELLVQIRLLQYGIQAAPPLKDSGNDLIAVNGETFRAVSVKTTKVGQYNKPKERNYHVLAVVELVGDGQEIYLDRSRLFLIPRERVDGASTDCANLQEFACCGQVVEQLFGVRVAPQPARNDAVLVRHVGE